MHQAAPAEMHAVLLVAFAPERDGDVADAHGLGDARAPGILEPGAEGRLAATGLAGDDQPPDRGVRQVETALRAPFR